MYELVKPWRINEYTFKEKSSKEYAISPLNREQAFVTSMLYMLFSRKGVIHFPLKWIPLIQRASNGFSFNSKTILASQHFHSF